MVSNKEIDKSPQVEVKTDLYENVEDIKTLDLEKRHMKIWPMDVTPPTRKNIYLVVVTDLGRNTFHTKTFSKCNPYDDWNVHSRQYLCNVTSIFSARRPRTNHPTVRLS